MDRDPDCIFCKIVAGEIPCFKIYEDDATLAFLDINPVHPGHALAIAKGHFANVYEISDEAIAATARTASRIARAVKSCLAPRGLNLLQCNGPAVAQSVDHFHMHVIPRSDDDKLTMNWDLVPGDMGEIGALAERIKAKLG